MVEQDVLVQFASEDHEQDRAKCFHSGQTVCTYSKISKLQSRDKRVKSSGIFEEIIALS